MFDLNLDASVFEYNEVIYNKDFEDILKGIIACYYCIISDKIMLPNDENQIRDIMLCRYLKNRLFKDANPPLSDYHFDSETVENKGRADIRILCVNPYMGDYDYYIIESNRMDNINQNGET
jgi:hypothetical protein